MQLLCRRHNARYDGGMQELLEFLANLDWMALAVTVVLTLIALLVGVWLPGKFIERHTNQPAARYVWYGVGTFTLIMVYIAAYGYGLFWNNVNENEKRDPYLLDGKNRTTHRQ